jgi:hypothetical protein
LDNCEKVGHCEEKEVDMPHSIPIVSFKVEANDSSGVSQFEPLLNSEQAAELLQIHRKTLQKLAQ